MWNYNFTKSIFIYLIINKFIFPKKIVLDNLLFFLIKEDLFFFLKKNNKLKKSKIKNKIKKPSDNQDYSLDLSILLSEGKETKKDSQSNCEWNGKT